MSDILGKAQEEVNEPQVDLEKTEHFNTGINTAWLKLEKYFKLVNRSPLYTAAIVLHPAWRLEYFEDKWAEHPDWIKTAKKTFKALFLKYSEKNASANMAVEPAAAHNESQSSKLKSTYLSYDGFSADYLKSFDHQLVIDSPLNWWKERQTEFPTLARMAFDVFSIPVISGEVE